LFCPQTCSGGFEKTKPICKRLKWTQVSVIKGITLESYVDFIKKSKAKQTQFMGFGLESDAEA
jgi:hypothetical protein